MFNVGRVACHVKKLPGLVEFNTSQFVRFVLLATAV